MTDSSAKIGYFFVLLLVELLSVLPKSLSTTMNRGLDDAVVDDVKVVQPGKNAALMRIDVDAKSKVESAQRTIFMMTAWDFWIKGNKMWILQINVYWISGAQCCVPRQSKSEWCRRCEREGVAVVESLIYSVLFVSWKDPLSPVESHVTINDRQTGLDWIFFLKKNLNAIFRFCWFCQNLLPIRNGFERQVGSTTVCKRYRVFFLDSSDIVVGWWFFAV